MSHTTNTSKKAMKHPALTEKTNTEDGSTATPPGNEIHHNQFPLHISNILA